MAKKIKFNELSSSELKVKMRDFGKNLIMARMKTSQRALKNTSEISVLRKNIARVKTFLNARKRAGENA